MENSPFQKLSAELRNRDWELTVTDEREVRLHTMEGPLVFERKATMRPPPSITHTCRQVRQESLSMFYARNKFVIRIETYPPLIKSTFVPDMKRAIKWLQRPKIRNHVVVPSLSVNFIHYYNGDDEDDKQYSLDRRLPYFTKLSETLDKRGYKQPRLRVIVYLHDLDEDTVDQDQEKVRVSKALKALGLDAVFLQAAYSECA